MKKIVTILFLCISFFGFSQKIRIKGTSVLIDKVEFLKIREDKVSKDSYMVSNLKGEDILYLKNNFYNDPSTIIRLSSGRYSSGNVYYFEVLSADLEKSYFESEIIDESVFGTNPAKNALLQIFNGDIINNDGSLNEDKLKLLSKKIGFEFSRKRDELK